MADELTGQAVNAFVAIKDGNEPSDALRKEFILQVRRSIGPFAAPKAVFVVPDLPKTRSGKIMRRILRKILAGEEDQLGDITTVSEHVPAKQRAPSSFPVLTLIVPPALGSVCCREDHRRCARGQEEVNNYNDKKRMKRGGYRTCILASFGLLRGTYTGRGYTICAADRILTHQLPCKVSI